LFFEQEKVELESEHPKTHVPKNGTWGTRELHGQRDISMREAASIVGNAIGKPNLAYVHVPSTMLGQVIVEMGLPKKTAELLIEMWDGANAGLIVPQEVRSAKNTTPTMLESFVTEVFAPAYLQTG
jgi:hypothetical protein